MSQDIAAPVTFRDFASHIFGGDLAAASTDLVTLLGVPADRARRAAEHFQQKAADPAFLPRAMSLRTAVEGTDNGAIVALLADCFGLEDAEATAATAVLRARYAK